MARRILPTKNFMETSAVPQRWTSLGLAVTAALAALSLACFATPSSAASLVGRDGTVHACYKVRGKAKGTVRLVAAHARCRRGERKAAWSTAGPAGQTGATGQVGPQGLSGLPGEAGLKSEVTALTKEVEVLKAKLANVTAAQLEEAVAAVTDVGELCTQTETLTGRANTLGEDLGKIALGGVIPTLLQLTVPTPPLELPAFTCS